MNKINWDLKPGRNKKNIEYYEKKSLTRGDFKRVCLTHKCNIKDFDEIYSGEKKGTNKKYFYKKK